MMAVKKNGINRCPKCGASDLTLNENSGKLHCNFCRAEFTGELANIPDRIENLQGDIVGSGAEDIIPGEEIILTLKCPACGAAVVINTEYITSARCHWCRHVLSINEKLPNGAVPDLVLPFKLSKAEAQAKIASYVMERGTYADSQFKNEFTTKNIMGVYLPYMVVDVNTHARFKGEAEHQTAQRKAMGSDEELYDADVFALERDFNLLINDLTIEASRDKLYQNTLVNTNYVINMIMPFDTEHSEAWHPGYLRGYASEKRDVNIGELSEIVNMQVRDIARHHALDGYYQTSDKHYLGLGTWQFYDRGARWANEEINVIGRHWKSAYLPVWLYSYLGEQNGKKLLHYVAVNARTGKTMGKIPLNKAKLTAVAWAIELAAILFSTVWVLFITHLIDSFSDSLGFIGYTALTILAGFGCVSLVSGVIFYEKIRQRYEEISQYVHVMETRCQVTEMRGFDRLINKLFRVSHPRIFGENGNKTEGSLVMMNTDKALAAIKKEQEERQRARWGNR